MADPDALERTADRLLIHAAAIRSALDVAARAMVTEPWRGPAADRLQTSLADHGRNLGAAADELVATARRLHVHAAEVRAIEAPSTIAGAVP